MPEWPVCRPHFVTELFLTPSFPHLSPPPPVYISLLHSPSSLFLLLFITPAWAPPLTQSSHPPLSEILIIVPQSLSRSVLYVVNQQTSPITIHSNQTHRVCWRACVRVRSLQHTIRCNEGMWQWTEFRRTLLVGPTCDTMALFTFTAGGPEEHNHVGINISHALVPDRLPTLLLTQL